jgi:copper(I)-binding protein
VTSGRGLRLAGAAIALLVVVVGVVVAVARSSGGSSGDSAESKPMAKAGDLAIYDGWVRTTTNDVSAAYSTVKNSGSADDTLLQVSTSASSNVQIHQMVVNGSSAEMQPVQGNLTVPAGGALTLSPAGYHAMVLDVKQPLNNGDTVQLTLEFARAGTVKLTVPVQAGQP